MGADALTRLGGEFEAIAAGVTPELDLLFLLAETDAERSALERLGAQCDALRSAALGDRDRATGRARPVRA